MANIEYVKDTFEEYLSKEGTISASDIKTFLESPCKFYYEKNNYRQYPFRDWI